MKIALNDLQKKMCCNYIDLLSSVINGVVPKEPPADFKWNFFCKQAQRNSVLNILACAIGKINNKPDRSIIKVAENERRVSIIKETSQLVEVEKILEEFEKAEIKNIPLKGYFMKTMYPQSHLRTMTDIDIYVDKADFKKVEEIFKKHNYSQSYLIRPDEIQFGKDVTYFEIQSNLNIGEDTYFANLFYKAEIRDGYQYSYKLNDEVFYIYMIYHCAKHFSSGGLGIRMLMDIYIYLQNHKNLNKEYLNNAFKELKLIEFEYHFRKTALNWFSNDKTEITPLGEFIIHCSTFGERNIYFYQDLSKTKGNYWLQQFFFPYSKMKKFYPYVEKFPFLLPFSWVQYWFTRIVINRNVRVKQGIKGRAGTISEEDKQFMDKLTKQLNM